MENICDDHADHDHDENFTIATINATSVAKQDETDTQILHLDEEIRSITENERTKWNKTFETAVSRTVDMVMVEQRTVIIKRGGEMIDKRRIMSARDERLSSKLEVIMD